jgi:hypothetical protein
MSAPRLHPAAAPLAAIAAVLLALPSCEHQERGGAASMQGPGVNDAIIAQLAAERCERERRCGNVGEGRQFSSLDTCEVRVRGDIAVELDAYNCPGGLERESVKQCLSAIHGEECNHPLNSLAAFEKCRGESLCMQQGYRHELVR